MTLAELLPGQPWMTPAEHDRQTRLVQSIISLLAERGIPESPFIALCVAETATMMLLCGRLENALIPVPDKNGQISVTPALANHIGRSRERLRKAIKELENACTPPKNTRPVPAEFAMPEAPSATTPATTPATASSTTPATTPVTAPATTPTAAPTTASPASSVSPTTPSVPSSASRHYIPPRTTFPPRPPVRHP